MLADGDQILVAVSGGVDSLVLAWLLQEWQKKAPIQYGLHPVHIDMALWHEAMACENPVRSLQREMEKCNVSLYVEKSIALPEEDRSCFRCSKLRRKQLFDLASRFKCNKIALGHHRDDLLETLLLNMFYSGNISTMVPAQKLFDGRLTIIRPLAYIEKTDVQKIAGDLDLRPVSNLCPLSGDTRREQVQQIVARIIEQIPDE